MFQVNITLLSFTLATDQGFLKFNKMFNRKLSPTIVYKITEILPRVLISQKPIDYCAGKLIENRARQTVSHRIAPHA